MAVISGQSIRSPFTTSPLPICYFPSPYHSKLARISCSPSSSSSSSSSSSASPLMGPQTEGGRKRFMEFPYVSAPCRDLMVELVSTMESRLAFYLLPCTLPPDVQFYHNPSKSAQASLYIRSGLRPSSIDFMLGSWLHCELPSGALNITSLSAYLSTSTDAPNFLMELVQASPTSLILVLDLPARKDVVFHPDYLQTFYEDTQLEKYQKLLGRIPEVRPYSPSSLYLRCLVSPTAILVHIETEAGETERMEEIVRDHVATIAKEVLGVWLDQCVGGQRNMEETDLAYLARRDWVMKTKTIEIDLASNLPRLFGQEVANRVIGVVREVFNI